MVWEICESQHENRIIEVLYGGLTCGQVSCELGDKISQDLPAIPMASLCVIVRKRCMSFVAGVELVCCMVNIE